MVRKNRADMRSMSSDSLAQHISETQPIIGMENPAAIKPVTKRE